MPAFIPLTTEEPELRPAMAAEQGAGAEQMVQILTLGLPENTQGQLSDPADTGLQGASSSTNVRSGGWLRMTGIGVPSTSSAIAGDVRFKAAAQLALMTEMGRKRK
ncbi:hypothetical protein AJ87_47260 [Rhizobium yanglingense]|nr:hypothetical protein AJ87_47260 [Rhizobium yanglingense]